MRLAIAHHCSATPMGQEFADRAVISGIRQIGADVTLTEVAVAGWRSAVPDAVRLPLGRIDRLPWSVQRALGGVMYRGHDVVHRMDLRLPPVARNEVLTVQDLAPLNFSDEGTLPRGASRSIASAAAIICPSRATAREVSERYGRDDADVVPSALDPVFLQPTPIVPAERSRLELPDQWILHTGGATERKNLRGLAAAWPAVRERWPDVGLVLCGPEDEQRNALFAGMPGVQLLGRVSRSLLLSLMTSAAAVVVPSRYEGYGLPVQEAMAVGVPVVATAATSLPEVAGPGAILVEDRPEALAAGLMQALAGVDAGALAAAQRLARERTQTRVAEMHLSVYRRVLNARRA